MRRTLVVGVAVLGLTALGVSPGSADTDTTSPTTSSTTSSSPAVTSPGTAAPTDSNGAPIVSPEQKVGPYVQPSVTFITIGWTAWLYDTKYHEYLNADDEGAHPITLSFNCTGYVVNPDGWIATAGHCVDPKEVRSYFIEAAVEAALAENWLNVDGRPATRAYYEDYWFDHLKTESSDETGATGKPDRVVKVWWGADVSGIETEKGVKARVQQFQTFDKGDGALLKINETDMNALLLVPGDTTVDTGTGIASIGYSGTVDDVTDADYHPSIKTGTVSSQKTIGDGLIPVYEVNGGMQHGMSGGPTVDFNGDVIGTNSFGNLDEDSNFNFVGTSQRILELLASNGVTNELSETSQTYRAGIDAYFAGDKDTAVKDLTTVHEAQPSNEEVTDYLARAKALPDPPAPVEESDSGGVSPWVWIVALVVLVAIAGAVAGLVIRNRRHPTPATYAPMAPTGYPLVQGSATPAPPVQEPPPAVEPDPPVYHMPPGPVAEPEVETDPEDEQPTEVQPRFCGNCGNQVPTGQRFCGSCGNPMA